MPTTAERQSGQYVDFDEYVDFQLDKVRKSVKLTDVLTALAGVGALVLGYLLVFVFCDHWIIEGGFGPTPRVSMLLLVIVAAIGWVVWKVVLPARRRVTALYAADMIEKAEPELQGNLRNLVDLRENGREGNEAVTGTMERRAALRMAEIDVDETVDRRRLLNVAYTLAAVVVLFCLYVFFSPKSISTSLWRALAPTAAVDVATRTKILEVKPGDAEILARAQLDVQVDVTGEEPETVELLFTTKDQRFVDEPLELRPDPDFPKRYHGTLVGENGRGLLQDLEYRIVAGDDTSETYRVTVVQPPAATVDEVAVTPPPYTGQEEKNRRGGHLDGWEGSTIRWTASTNQPVERAMIQFSDDETFANKAEELRMRISPDGRTLTATLEDWAKRSALDVPPYPKYYRVQVWNERGDNDPEPTAYRVQMKLDLPPEVSLLDPTEDLVGPKARPANGNVPLTIRAEDDYGVKSLRVKVAKDGETIYTDPIDVVDGTTVYKPEQPFTLKLHQPGRLELDPGDVIEVSLQARDNKHARGRDGDFEWRPQVSRETTPLRIEIAAPADPAQLARQAEQDDQRRQRRIDQERRENGEGERRPGEAAEPGDPQPGEGDPGDEPREGMPGEGDPREGDPRPGEGDPMNAERQPGEGNPAERNPDDPADPADPTDIDPMNDPGEQAPNETRVGNNGDEDDLATQRILEQLNRDRANRDPMETPADRNPDPADPMNIDPADPGNPTPPMGDDPMDPMDPMNPDPMNPDPMNPDPMNPDPADPMNPMDGGPMDPMPGEGDPMEDPNVKPMPGEGGMGMNTDPTMGRETGDPKPGEGEPGTNPKPGEGTQPKPGEGDPMGMGGEPKPMPGEGSDTRTPEERLNDEINELEQLKRDDPSKADDVQDDLERLTKDRDDLRKQRQREMNPDQLEDEIERLEKQKRNEPGAEKQPGDPDSPEELQKEIDELDELRKEKMGGGEPMPGENPGEGNPMPGENPGEGNPMPGETPMKGNPGEGMMGGGDPKPGENPGGGMGDPKPGEGPDGMGKPTEPNGGDPKPGEVDPNGPMRPGDPNDPARETPGEVDPDGMPEEGGPGEPMAGNDPGDLSDEQLDDEINRLEQLSRDPEVKEKVEGELERLTKEQDRRNMTRRELEEEIDRLQKLRNQDPRGERRPGDPVAPEKLDDEIESLKKTRDRKEEGDPMGRPQPGEGDPMGDPMPGEPMPGMGDPMPGEGNPMGDPKPGEGGMQPGEGDPNGAPKPGEGMGDQPGPAGRPDPNGQPGMGGNNPGGGGQPRGNGDIGDVRPNDSNVEDAAVDVDEARRATELALDELEGDLKRGEVDEKLLERLGWSEEDLARYVDRMKQRFQLLDENAERPESEARKRQFEEMLKGLDFRSTGEKREGRDDRRRNVDGFGGRDVPAPAEYRDAADAFDRALPKLFEDAKRNR